MKKFFAFGLMLLLFAVVQSMAPKTAPIDNDVGIYYVMSADQIQSDMNIVAINSSPLYFSDYAVPVWADVGSSACINNPKSIPEILWQSSEPTIVSTNAKINQAIRIEGLSCTGTGDIYSQDRVLSRHT